MDQRIALKLENTFLEQTYKFRIGESIENFEDAKRICNAKFIDAVESLFKQMEGIRIHHGPKADSDENEFDEII